LRGALLLLDFLALILFLAVTALVLVRHEWKRCTMRAVRIPDTPARFLVEEFVRGWS
jgi:hypothetical protein